MRSKWFTLMISLVVLTSLAVPAAAQSGSNVEVLPQAAASTVWFYGFVREQGTNSPLAAWVTLRAFDAARGWVPVAAGPTNASGRYQLPYNGTANKFLIIVEGPDGYAPNPSGRQIALSPGQNLIQRDFFLKPGFARFQLPGYVKVLGTNAPVQGVGITVLAWDRITLGFILAGSTTTDSAGYYSFDYNGPSGRFMIEVRPPGGYSPAFQSDQEWVALGVSPEVKTFFVRSAVQTFTFTGNVYVKGTTAGIAGAAVGLFQWSDAGGSYLPFASMSTGSDGAFTLPYTGGASKFRLVCTGPTGYGPASQLQDLEIESGETPPAVIFYLEPNARTLAFRGQVLLQGTTSGVPNVWITLRAFDPPQGKFVVVGAMPTSNQGGFLLQYTGTLVKFQLIAEAHAPWAPASQQVEYTILAGQFPPATTFYVTGPPPNPRFIVYLLRQGAGTGVVGGWVTLRAWNGSQYVAVAAGPTNTDGRAVLAYTGTATKFLIIAQPPAGYTPAMQTKELTVPLGTRPPDTTFYVTP